MNARKAKEARRTMRALFSEVSEEPQHSNVQHITVDKDGRVSPTVHGKLVSFVEELLQPITGTFYYTTSTVTVPARAIYRTVKRRVRGGGQHVRF